MLVIATGTQGEGRRGTRSLIMAEATPAPHEAPVGGSGASLAAYAAARSSRTTSAAFKPAGDSAPATPERSLTTM